MPSLPILGSAPRMHTTVLINAATRFPLAGVVFDISGSIVVRTRVTAQSSAFDASATYTPGAAELCRSHDVLSPIDF